MPHDTTRWSVTVSRDTDLALRAHLGEHGLRRGELSRFIEEAVRWRMLDQTVQTVKDRHADLPPDDLQAAIDAACDAVRSDMWPAQPPV